MNAKRPDPLVIAIEALAKSDHLSLTLRQKLLAKGFSVQEVEVAIEQLSEWGLLNDESTAENWARRASEHAGKGRLKIVSELVARGVELEVAECLSMNVLSEEDERRRAQTILNSRFGPKDRPDKAARYLASRGFAPELIESLVEDFFSL